MSETEKNPEMVVYTLRNNMYGFIKEERNRYADLYRVIKDYVIENKLMLSDPYMITNLSNNSDVFLDYHYTVYCSRPLTHANTIVNLLYDELMANDNKLVSTLVMNTVVKNEEFSISFDNRYIAKIFAMQRNRPKGKSVDISKLIAPHYINKVPYLPAEIEIIDIYNRIYTNQGSIQALLDIEEKMGKYIVNKVGGEVELIKIGGDIKTCYERKKDVLEAIKLSIIKNFLVDRTDLALLGPMAVEWLQNAENICPKYDRIQLVGTLTIEELKTELEKYVKMLGQNNSITVGEELDLLIPKDFRTKRAIFSLIIKTDFGIKEKPFLEYFNSCNFELVPVFESNKILIVNKYVLLRFLFIDLWVSKFIYSVGKIDKESYTTKQGRYLELIKETNKLPFIADGTIGVYYEYDVSKKEQKISQEHFFIPYYPYGFFLKNKQLRSV